MKNVSTLFGCLGALLTLAGATNANATSWQEDTTYYVRLHFSAIAFGKQVSNVVAHVGAEIQNPYDGSAPVWHNTHDVALQRTGDHFSATTHIESFANGGFRNHGPKVVYFVDFSDGPKSLITPVIEIPVEQSFRSQSSAQYESDQKLSDKDLLKDLNFDHTYCEALVYGFVG